MSIIDEITVEDFKTQFPRWAPSYLPIYEARTYFNGDVVYYDDNFYQCTVESTVNDPSVTSDWKLIKSSVLYYTQDSDITNAFAEARVNFNESLFSDDDTKKLIFLYLTAYYLTVDFNNVTNANGGLGIVQSKTVGSVSESYAIPQWVLKSPILSMYAQNGYGRKYLSLIQPYITGNIILAKGATTWD